MKKPFTEQDLYRYRSIAAIEGAAGGERLLFVVSRALRQADRYESVLWCLDAADGEPAPQALTLPQFNVRSPRLAPDGETVAFLSRRGDGAQVHLLSLTGGEARQLGRSAHTPSSIQDWSPDGGALLVAAGIAWAEDADDDPRRPGKARPRVVNFLPYKSDGGGSRVGERTQLLRIDVASGEERILVGGDFDLICARYSPDGRRLAYIRGRGGRQRHREDLWLADADGGNARRMTDDLASVQGLAWSPDGCRLAFGGSRTEGDSRSALWLLDVGTGALDCPFGDALEVEGSDFVWHADGRRLALIAARRGLHEIVVADLDRGTLRPLHGGLRHVLGLGRSRDRLAFAAESLRQACELYSVRWDGDDQRRLTALNRRWFGNRRRPRVVKRRFEVPDGRGGLEKIDAWLLRPRQGDGPFPLLVDMHGGPQSVALIDFSQHLYWYLLCSRGWAIVAPNAVGSGSYGAEFAERLRGHWGELDLPQHLAIVDTLQREGVADERIACAGKSYGGFLGAWAIGRSDRFKAAVVSAPVANVESHAGTSDTGYYVTPYAMGGEIGQRRERYQALSPVEYCIDVQAAVLLLQGEDDQRCPLGQSEELFAHLIRCSQAPARMVVYPGGSHSLASSGKPGHRADYHRRLTAWLDEWTR